MIEIKAVEEHGGRTWAVLMAAANVLAASGLVKIYGLQDQVYFNKNLLSAAVFLVSLVLVPMAAGDLRRDRRLGGYALALSWLLAFTEILGLGLRRMLNALPSVVNLPSCLWMMGSALAFCWLLEPFFFRVFSAVQEKTGRDRRGSSVTKVFFITWAAAFVGYLPCFFAFFPGLYCYDMIWQWAMYVSDWHSTHHPLVHTLLSGWLLELGNRFFGNYNAGLVIHSMFQLLVLSGSVAFAVRFLYKLRVPRKIWLAAAVFYIFFPFFPVLGLSTTKDVIFGCLFLNVFVCICEMVNARRLWRGWRLAAFLLLTVLMGLFRNNAVYGLLFLAVCVAAGALLFRRQKTERRLLLAMLLALLVSIVGIKGGFYALERGLDAHKGSVAEMLSVPCQQLARTYVYHGEEMQPEDKEELFHYIPEDALASYIYYVSDPVKGKLDANYLAAHTKEFFRLWARIGKQFPGEFVLAPVCNTMGVWYMGGDSSCYMEFKMSPLFSENYVVEEDSKLPLLRDAYRWFTDKNIQEHLPLLSLIFYTAFYAWLVLAAMTAVLARGNYLYLTPCMYLAGYILTLFLGPCVTVRYMMGVMLCVPVLLAVVFFGMVPGRRGVYEEERR